jgi:hypothetical protein
MSTRLIYPEELRSKTGFRPMMRMKCIESNSGENLDIYVPIPTAIGFSDGASYDDAVLGIIGGSAMRAARGLGPKGTDIGGAVNAAVDQGKSLLNSGRNVKNLIAGALEIAGGGIGDEIKSGVSIGIGTTLNKNITTEFTGVGVRSFTFSFKFVSKSETETQVINSIIKGFRANLYPMGDLLALKYPPKWNIEFLNSVLPRIFECYLTTLESNFNPTINAWHTDGSPIETDVSVTFKESRALTYEDIASLETRPFQKGDFESRYSVPLTASSIDSTAVELPRSVTTVDPERRPLSGRGQPGAPIYNPPSSGNNIPLGGFGIFPPR